MRYRIAADALTAVRALAGLALPFWPSALLLAIALVTDVLDGPLARRAKRTRYGARFDLEADSLLTLGAALGAVRRGAPAVLLIAPIARYPAVVARAPSSLTASEIAWDRATGAAQMALLVAGLAAPLPHAFRPLLLTVVGARLVALAACLAGPAVHSNTRNRPAEARLVRARGGRTDDRGAVASPDQDRRERVG